MKNNGLYRRKLKVSPWGRFRGAFYFFCFISHISFSQINLVPNPSFEDTIACPSSPGQINFATSWINPTMASPDYMNSCNTTQFGVPSNYLGVQNAHTGKAYALVGMYCYCPGSNNYREYIQVSLNNFLIKDEKYCIEFYVSLMNGKYLEYAVNNIGVYFSTTAVSSTNYDPLPYVPQVINPPSNPLTNTGVWTKVSGQYISQGGERYITIGNFNDNATSDTVFIKKGSSLQSGYYIDDVSVIHLDADAGKDTAICKGSSLQLGRATSAGLAYNWQPATSLSNTSIAQPIATPTVTTTYYLTATLNGGCAKQDTVTVTVVNANAGNDTTLCKGSSVTLGTTALTGVTYNWLPTTGLNNATLAQPTATPTSTTTYTLIASANGCTQTDAVSITVLPFQTPISNAGTAQTICLGDTLNIGATATVGYKYVWQPNINLSDASSANPFAFPKQTTLYTLTVMDTASTYLCKTTSKDSVLITIDECPPILPNVFTPNGDGVNDVFIINNLTPGSTINIYNRWGTLVWNPSPLERGRGEAFWDGRTPAGLPCVEGVYYYIVNLPDGKMYKGFLELLR